MTPLARHSRGALIALTILALLMPRISAAVAFMAPGVQTVVICTGDGLRTISIDADGNPAPVSDHDSHCVLTHAADTAVPVTLAATMASQGAEVGRPVGHLVALTGDRGARPPPRAPPVR